MFSKGRMFSVAFACCMVLGLMSCYARGVAPDAAPPRDGTAAVANPAAQKCLEDGYTLEPIVSNGVPTGHFCVNPATGRRCEVWKYFRGECTMMRK